MLGAAPLPDPAEVDERIAACTAAADASPAGTPEYRAARVELAKWLFARYTAGGADVDRVVVDATCRSVLADPGATADERQTAGLIQPLLTMLAIFRPGAAPLPAADALAGTMREVAAQADAAREDLPADTGADLHKVLGVVSGFARVVEDAQQPDWDGRIAPKQAARLADLPADLPGRAEVAALLAWLGGPADPGAQSGEVRAALADLPADHLLGPVLRLDLARAVAGDPATATPDALVEACSLLEQVRDGGASDDPLHAEATGMLAGALLAATAHRPTAAAVARVEQVVGEMLARPQDAGPGAVDFLQALIGMLRALAEGAPAEAAVTGALSRAITELPSDDPLRPIAIGQAAALLSDRFLREGRADDSDAATAIAEELVRAATHADDGSAPFLRCVAALCGVVRAGRLGDVADLDAASPDTPAAALCAGLADLPRHDLMRPTFAFVAVIAALQVAAASQDRAQMWAVAQEARYLLDTAPPAGFTPAVVATLAGSLDVALGALGADPAVVTAAIARMEADLAAEEETAVVFADQRVGRRALLGLSHLAAQGLGVERTASRAVVHLRAALRLLGDTRPGVQRHEILRGLARAHRAGGNHPAAREAGFVALESLAGVVLLQSGAGHAVRVARGASTDAAELARWCIADGDPARAAQAMELGRGLALHAAVSATRVPDVLREAGRPDLAREWEEAATAVSSIGWAEALDAGLHASGDLRHRVLDVLRATRAGAQLFVPPTLGAVGEALAAVGADVLVYLVPAEGAENGSLLVIGRDGVVRVVAAPGLGAATAGPIATLLNVDERPATLRWAVHEVAKWAGAAVVAPLRDYLRQSAHSLPRIVLVPAGELGVVPWAAAQLPGPGRVRHACEELVISTAASARQLLDVAARSLAVGRAVLVGDPTGSLPRAAEELAALHEGLYPDAVVLDGPAATPEAVLDRMSGAALLHVACHAVTAESVDESRLELTTALPVRRILERAGAAGGAMVVLSSCGSDLSIRDRDESLTLATAFLAAGAATAVASRWPVLDRSAGIVAFALYHFHMTGLRPAEALRRAQLWLLDPDREPLPGMPDAMRRYCRRGHLAEMVVWAAFGHQGR